MKIKGLRWWIITLICFATVINYIDRSALGIMWPQMGKDLGMDESDYAVMLNIFMITYAAGKFLSGKLYDIIGTRLGFTVSIVVWSLASAFHAGARGLFSMTLFRGILGLGEAGNWPGAVKSNGEWFPIQQRAMAQGIFNAGASLGSVIAPVLIAFLFGHYGWRSTYIIIGVVGILWVIPWLFINKSTPEKHPWITEEELNLIVASSKVDDAKKSNEKEKGLSVLQILKHRESWGVIVGSFFIEPIWWLFVGWMPLYLHSKFGFSIAEIGSTIWISYLGGMAGSLIGGWYCGKLMETKSLDAARKITIAIGCALIFIGLLAIIFLVDTSMSFIYIVGIVLFGFQFAIGNLQTLSSDLFKGPSVGTLAGFAGTIGAFSVIIINWLIPQITKVSYTPAFIIIAILAPLAILSILFFIKKIEQIDHKF